MGAPTQSRRIVAGRYRLVRALGSGGMGTVWLAADQLLDREVAVKEVYPPADVTENERAQLRERTLREARIAARLSHPNVVTIYDVVEDGGRPWIVMELLPARSLRDIVAEDGPVTPQRAAEIGLQLLAALGAAHALGIMHRDVKPGNVLIDADGRAVLADFGIARTQDSSTLTTSGVLVGSPSYIAPERARGERGGPESDLWSLGATLYAAIEGRPPYDRNGALATLTAVVTEEPDPPSRCGALWPVISRLLARDPAQRPGAAETGDILRRVAGDGRDQGITPPRTYPVTAPMPGMPGREADGRSRSEPAATLENAERTLAFHPQAPVMPPPAALPEAAPERSPGQEPAAEGRPEPAAREEPEPAAEGEPEVGAGAVPAADPHPGPRAQPEPAAGRVPVAGQGPPLSPAPERADELEPAGEPDQRAQPAPEEEREPLAGPRLPAGAELAAAPEPVPAPELAAAPEAVLEPGPAAEPGPSAPRPAITTDGEAGRPPKPEPVPAERPLAAAVPPPTRPLARREGAKGSGTAPLTRRPDRPTRRRVRLLGGLVAVAAAAGIFAAVGNLGHHPAQALGPSGAHRRSAAPSQPAAGNSATPSQPASGNSVTASAPASPATPSAGPTGTTAASGAGASARVGSAAPVPAGYHRYYDPTGFSIAMPDGWGMSHQGHYVYLVPPSGAEFLLIDQSSHPQPNPLADWQQQEANRESGYAGYHRIRLVAIHYPQAEKAADWEFTYYRQGILTHVLNRNVLANATHAYALYWSTPQAQWNQSWHIFQVLAQTFQPAP